MTNNMKTTITTKSGVRAVHNPYPGVMNSPLWRGYIEVYENGEYKYTVNCQNTYIIPQLGKAEAEIKEYEMSGSKLDEETKKAIMEKAKKGNPDQF
jgi:hypothetical protein